MLKVITDKKFAGNRKIFSPVDDYMNTVDFSTLCYDTLEYIIRRIDNTQLNKDNSIDAKFSSGQRINVDQLSTGCKAAILIYSESTKENDTIVDISECGENAMLCCFDLLEKSNVTGLLYADTLTTWQKRDILINNTHQEENTSMICVYMEE